MSAGPPDAPQRRTRCLSFGRGRSLPRPQTPKRRPPGIADPDPRRTTAPKNSPSRPERHVGERAPARVRAPHRPVRVRQSMVAYRVGMKRPTDEDGVEASRRFLVGLVGGDDANQLSAAIADSHARNNTFPGEVFLELAADALDLNSRCRTRRRRRLSGVTVATPSRSRVPRQGAPTNPVRDAHTVRCTGRPRAGPAR